MAVNLPLLEPVALEPGQIQEELGELPRVPKEAFLWGELPPRPRVAIVGSRKASPLGLRVARRVAEELARNGVCIVSGGAAGIDRAAHEGALAVGGQTLVVGPVWLDHAYPVDHRPLFREVIERAGGYLAVTGPEAQPLRPNFHRRNAALVCLSECLLIGESGASSGALNAAAVARRLGRHRFVLPWAPDSPCTRGSECELLLRAAVPYFRAQQVLDLLCGGAFMGERWVSHRLGRSLSNRAAARGGTETGRPPSAAPTHRRKATCSSGQVPRPDGSAADILAALSEGPKTVDQLCVQLSRSVDLVSHQVLLLTLEGLVHTRMGFVERTGSAPR